MSAARGVYDIGEGIAGRDMGGDYLLHTMGRCVRCGRQTLAKGLKFDVTKATATISEFDAEPRGVCGGRACYPIHATEHGATGRDVVACWDCMNERGREAYDECMKMARAVWAAAPVIQTFKNAAGYWSLVVDGRRVIAEESYQVVQNVADSLQRGGTGTSECDEVARGILAGRLPA